MISVRCANGRNRIWAAAEAMNTSETATPIVAVDPIPSTDARNLQDPPGRIRLNGFPNDEHRRPREQKKDGVNDEWHPQRPLRQFCDNTGHQYPQAESTDVRRCRQCRGQVLS